MPKLGASIGKVLAFHSQTTKEVLEGGALLVKLLCRKGDKIATMDSIAKNLMEMLFGKFRKLYNLLFTKSLLHV